MYLEHRLPALLQIHYHSRLNTWLQLNGQRRTTARRDKNRLWFGATYIIYIYGEVSLFQQPSLVVWCMMCTTRTGLMTGCKPAQAPCPSPNGGNTSQTTLVSRSIRTCSRTSTACGTTLMTRGGILFASLISYKMHWSVFAHSGPTVLRC